MRQRTVAGARRRLQHAQWRERERAREIRERERKNPAETQFRIRLGRERYDECYHFEECAVCRCEKQLGVRIVVTKSSCFLDQPGKEVMRLCLKCAQRIGRAAANAKRKGKA